MGYDTTTTDAKGDYKLSVDGSPLDNSFDIHVADVDGDENGNYQSVDTVVYFTDSDFDGSDSGWFEGEATQTLDLKLKVDSEE